MISCWHGNVSAQLTQIFRKIIYFRVRTKHFFVCKSNVLSKYIILYATLFCRLVGLFIARRFVVYFFCAVLKLKSKLGSEMAGLKSKMAKLRMEIAELRSEMVK